MLRDCQTCSKHKYEGHTRFVLNTASRHDFLFLF